MLYTTNEKINTRLRQRLQLGGVQSTFGRSVIPEPEVEQIANQVEARVNMRLKSKYRLPLRLTDVDAANAISSIVEKLTICDLIAPNFAGVDPSQEGGYIRNEFCTQGNRELNELIDSVIDGEIAIGVTANSQLRSPVVGKRSGGTVVEF